MGHPKEMVAKLSQLFVAVASVLLGLRVFLALFNIEPSNSFVQWVYSMSSTLLLPFRSVFPPQELNHNSVLDVSALFAMLAYAFVGYLVLVAVDVLPKPKVKRKINLKKILN